MTPRVLVAAVTLCFGFTAFGVPNDGVTREGEGARRAALDARELKPFDFGTFAQLSDWQNGGTLSAGEAAGKPVLIVTWTDYIAQSKRALALAGRMADKYGPQGLLVVAAHGPQEWTEASKPKSPKEGTLLVAHDAKGGFRDAIASDADPDFYVIDRAGQLRFADIMTESVDAACEKVVAETRDLAAGENSRLKSLAATQAAELRRSEALRTGVDLTNMPEATFAEPSTDEYKKAAWPKPPEDETAKQALQPGQKYDPFADLGKFSAPEPAWYPSRPTTKGRVMLLYFWHPEARFSIQQIDYFEMYQRQMGRDVTVVGIISAIGDNSGQSKYNMDAEFLKETMEKYHKQKNLRQYFLVDADNSLFELSKKHYASEQFYPIPWGMLVSSDGTLHWWGHLRGPKGQAAMDKMMVVDPGVQARRDAEAEFIKSKGGQ